ncbi:MAG: sigma-70 family RNA polymerase sigma factor [Planctomycetota bacterium]
MKDKKNENEKRIRDLIRLAQQGDAEAVNEIYLSLERELVLYVYRNMRKELRNLEGTRDMIQTLWKGVLKDIGDFEYRDHNSFVSWLKQCLLNKIRERGRKIRKELEPLDPEFQRSAPDPTPAGKAVKDEQIELFMQKLAKFPDETRRILVYRFREDKTYEEIGILLGKSADAVRKKTVRSLELLKKQMEAEGKPLSES